MSTLDGGYLSTSRPGRLTSGKAPEPARTVLEKKKSLHLPAFKSRNVQSVASHSTDYVNNALRKIRKVR
jgi:hypothetical protein